jgi:hypothetical protein
MIPEGMAVPIPARKFAFIPVLRLLLKQWAEHQIV